MKTQNIFVLGFILFLIACGDSGIPSGINNNDIWDTDPSAESLVELIDADSDGKDNLVNGKNADDESVDGENQSELIIYPSGRHLAEPVDTDAESDGERNPTEDKSPEDQITDAENKGESSIDPSDGFSVEPVDTGSDSEGNPTEDKSADDRNAEDKSPEDHITDADNKGESSIDPSDGSSAEPVDTGSDSEGNPIEDKSADDGNAEDNSADDENAEDKSPEDQITDGESTDESSVDPSDGSSVEPVDTGSDGEGNPTEDYSDDEAIVNITINNVELNSLSSDLGFKIIGESSGDKSGQSVSSAGDIDGDGIDDLIIGAPGVLTKKGTSYVVYGGRTENLNLDSLFTDHGFKIIGESGNDESGHSVSGAGDINGDGYDDLIIGAPYAKDSGTSSEGISYVVYGAKRSDLKEIDFSESSASYYGFKIIGVNDGDQSGYSVSSAGDVNGDGYDDLIIGAPIADSQRGISYVVYGEKGNRYEDVELSAFFNADNTDGFRIIGHGSSGRSGFSVSSAGNINGDVYDDLIISTERLSRSYVLYGTNDSSDVVLQEDSLSINNGYIFKDNINNHTTSVSGAGDINGDGFDDLIIGARYAESSGEHHDNDRGVSYVVYGSRERDAKSDVVLNNLSSGDGFKIIGESEKDQSGYSVSGAGDINGDGYDDLIIGAPWADIGTDTRVGTSYVVYGKKDTDRGEIDLSTFDGTDYDYTDGFKINGANAGDQSGYSVSGAGDINGDGFDDLIIGAYEAEPDGQAEDYNSGISYVVYGNYSEYKSEGKTLSDVDGNIGTYLDDDLALTTGDKVLIGGAGDDKLYIGDEQFTHNYNTTYSIDGGNGDDTLVFTQSRSLDFTGNDPSFRRTSIQDIEVIDMTHSDGTLSLRPIDLVNLSTTSNDLTVRGGNLHLYQGPTDGAGWYELDGNWANYVNNAVIKIEGDSEVDGPRLMKTIEFDKDFNISVDEDAVTFKKSMSDDPHYLSLDDADEVLNGLTELTIEMEFELDFTRNSETEHAYLFSLAENDKRANMLSIFLKDRSGNSSWDLSIWAQNDDKDNGNAGDDQKFFLKENWIKGKQRVVLWVAIDLAGDGNVSVYWQDKSNDASVPERQELGNKCPSSHNQCGGKWSDIDMLKVGPDGAVFGNDQDKLGGEFDYKQAFEGEFYGLKIYDKFFEPSSANAANEANATLIYSLLPGNVVAK